MGSHNGWKKFNLGLYSDKCEKAGGKDQLYNRRHEKTSTYNTPSDKSSSSTTVLQHFRIERVLNHIILNLNVSFSYSNSFNDYYSLLQTTDITQKLLYNAHQNYSRNKIEKINHTPNFIDHAYINRVCEARKRLLRFTILFLL